MKRFHPDDFEKLLNIIKNEVNDIAECGEIRSIESNYNTKGMLCRSRINKDMTGTIFAGEDNGRISVDIDAYDGLVRNFLVNDENDQDSINNIVGWLKDNYK